jgi:hypothetical protein
MSNKEETNAPTEEEIKALWEKYLKVHNVYWNARCKAVDKAVASVSDLRATSSEAYEAYRLARYDPHATPIEAPKDIPAPLEELARLFPWPTFRAVGRRILGGKK